ncbi:MAG: transketolase family protein [Candidatus Nomurabacteria bacterium]|jgi:transketolase|nr:transketolase family protein [Candidatus Nomurabacteria bacterium]
MSEPLHNMRAGFGRGLIAAAAKDPRVVALAADLAGSCGLTDFIKKFPNRFVEVGIAEQNLVGLASGMAAAGLIPFAASYAAFSPGRNWEQIRTMICLNDRPVKLIGSHAGLNVGADGATHQMLEDIALMRVLPNMKVFAPADAVEAAVVTQAMARDPAPNYVRLARDYRHDVFDENYGDFQIGKARILRGGDDITLASTGTTTALALEAADILKKQNISAEVIHFATIKPLDTGALLKSVSKTRHIISIEEHQIAGGFGGAVAEVLAQEFWQAFLPAAQKFAVDNKTRHSDAQVEGSSQSFRLKIIGVDDKFGQSGTLENLWEFYGLSADNVAAAAKELLS